MYKERVRSHCISMELKRVLWLIMALALSLVLLIFHYFQLSYGGKLLSSLLSLHKSQVNSSHFNSEFTVMSFNISTVFSKNGVAPEISPIGNTSERSSPPNSSFEAMINGSTSIQYQSTISAKKSPSVTITISEMNNAFLQSRHSYRAMKPNWASEVDEEVLNARRLIVEGAEIMEKNPDIDVDLYRNYSEFARSYELMKKILKIYIYTQGEKPIFHQPQLSGIYASEGWFMKQLQENTRFVTKNPDKAHLFYLPFSSQLLEETMYVRDSHNKKNLIQYLSRYLENITTAYLFWNRTDGADHFLVACHDWAPSETRRIMKKCIRSLCNADASKGFKFGKDVSLPEIHVLDATNPLKNLGGKPVSQRSILAFFAGQMHGYLRPLLFKYWENKDPDIKIFGKLNDSKDHRAYTEYMKSSKYCISAKGYAPYTPRVVEAIFYECVPVIISDNFVPPFFETLNWESFAVFVLERDIPNLKRILLSISEERYVEMQRRVRRVQRHFLWHKSPVEHDVFHMILHSVWYTKVFQVG